MRQFVIFLIIFLASIFLGMKISEDPGFAFFSYKNWSMEMPLWFAIVATMLGFFIFYWLVKISDCVDFSLYRLRNWLSMRRKYKSYSKTNRGLVELIEGNYAGAERYLLEGIPQSDAPLINYLAAAKAAQEQRAYDKRDAYLRKAHTVASHAELVIGLLQAQLLLDQGQLEQALATLNHLRVIAPKHKAVLKLLERVHIHLGDWQELLKLLPTLRKAKLVTPEQFSQFEKRIYTELLKAATNKNETNVRAIWQAIPGNYQKDPDLIYTYVTLMMGFQRAASELEYLITKALKRSWHPGLAKLYGQLEITPPIKQLSRAEAWSKVYPNQAILLATLGRLAARAQLWGKARGYYDASIKYGADSDTYIAYGKLLEQLGDNEAAAQLYQQGLAIMSFG